MRIDTRTERRERRARPHPQPSRATPEFPGCRAVTLKREDLDTHDGRFEFWDGDTETAWMVREPTTDTHELPSQRLARLSELIAQTRGSPIECFGAMDLVLRGERGERRRILQADQCVYLYPGRSRLPEGAGMVVGEHDFPDVVVEVDHTTDVRRGKLRLYEEWGFPELWVEVPDRYPPSRRPPGRRPGLVIQVLDGGAYRTVAESGAFPGWTAGEIHTAMNEPELSEATGQVLDRVGRALGAREGTGPDDTPWLRGHRREGHARGHVEGYAKGRTEGYAEGQAEGRAELMAAAMRKISASRGISGIELPLDARELAGVSDEEVLDALIRCADASDFRARLRSLQR